MAPFFSRKKVRNTLRDMAYAGCNVQVLARQDTMTRDFCDRLDPRKVVVKIAPAPTKDRVTIHAKYVLVDGSYGGGVGHRITWVGSHNFTDNALRGLVSVLRQLGPTLERSRHEFRVRSGRGQGQRIGREER